MFRSMLLVGSVLSVCILTTVAVHADSPREFLYKAQQGNNSEIMLGRLAAERGRNPAVREFGQTLVSEHRQARDEVRALGAKFGLRPNRDPSPEAAEERETLMNLSGRRFDREFIRYMVDDHEKDVAAFREQAREGRGEVSELARRQLPSLRHHLEMARALDNEPGRFGSNSGPNERGSWSNRDNYNRDNRGPSYDIDRAPADNEQRSQFRNRQTDGQVVGRNYADPRSANGGPTSFTNDLPNFQGGRGQSVAQTPTQSAISVTSSTYGGNCKAPKGNVSQALQSACNGKATCQYTVNHLVTGDPAPGCAKDFNVAWSCGTGADGSASLPVEASGGKVTLSCPAGVTRDARQGRPR